MWALFELSFLIFLRNKIAAEQQTSVRHHIEVNQVILATSGRFCSWVCGNKTKEYKAIPRAFHSSNQVMFLPNQALATVV